MTPEQLFTEASLAIAQGTRMTLVKPQGTKMPPKFPRGELLCENYDGRHCYSYDPLRVLAWLVAIGFAKAEEKDKVQE